MDTALPQKFPFILDRNLEKANCTENRVCTSCDQVVLVMNKYLAQLTQVSHFGPPWIVHKMILFDFSVFLFTQLSLIYLFTILLFL